MSLQGARSVPVTSIVARVEAECFPACQESYCLARIGADTWQEIERYTMKQWYFKLAWSRWSARERKQLPIYATRRKYIPYTTFDCGRSHCFTHNKRAFLSRTSRTLQGVPAYQLHIVYFPSKHLHISLLHSSSILISWTLTNNSSSLTFLWTSTILIFTTKHQRTLSQHQHSSLFHHNTSVCTVKHVKILLQNFW